MKSSCLYLAIYLVILWVQPRRYLSWLPTIPLYPSNTEEVQVVRRWMARRQPSQEALFYHTDPSIVYAFQEHVSESIVELQGIISRVHVLLLILGSKLLFNRARPAQIDPHLRPLESETAQTPAYPSGHAFQAYYLAEVLAERYPEKTTLFHTIAQDCADARVYAGLHYPSDNERSRQMVQLLFPHK